MRDFENTLGFNYSRFSSNGWQNLPLDETSQDKSLTARSISNQHFNLQLPPQPVPNIYNCLQGQESDNSIKQIQQCENQPFAKRVNSKQYYRMMKRRIKKVLLKFAQHQASGQGVSLQNKGNNKGYLYQSRHRHAVARLRGPDGKFLATRPASERFREKKKRGPKPKLVQISEQK